LSNREHIHLPTHPLDKVTDGITWFVGSWIFLIVSVVWFVLWFVLRVEAFPFGFLTLCVSLEAILLSIFILMSQNRQSKKDRVRDNLEADEVTEILNSHQELLQLNRTQLEINQTQLEILNQQTKILHLLQQVKRPAVKRP
jgi:uncharacterized membrane protein